MQQEEQIRVKSSEISDLCQKWRNFRYRGESIQAPAIREWLAQFNSAEDQRLMFRLLSETRIYDEHTLRTKMKEAFGIVTRNIYTRIEAGLRVRSDILVSSLDDSLAKSGSGSCKLFANENQISTQSVQALESLRPRFTDEPKPQRLVLIDDFSGTGETLVKGLKKHLELLQYANAQGIRIIIVAVVGFTQSLDHIRRFVRQNGLDADVYFCDQWGLEHQVFSEMSTVFPDPAERERAKQIAESKGLALEDRHPLGYKDTQALVVFHQSCPNNTLPILWSKNHGWRALFPRI